VGGGPAAQEPSPFPKFSTAERMTKPLRYAIVVVIITDYHRKDKKTMLAAAVAVLNIGKGMHAFFNYEEGGIDMRMFRASKQKQ